MQAPENVGTEMVEQLVAGGLLRLAQAKLDRPERTPIFAAPASVPEAERPVPRDCSLGNYMQIVMETVGNDYIFEPSPARLLEVLVPRYVNFQVWRALLESSAGEQAARMTAMDNASKNAGELIEELTQEMNKERQSNITLELMDIVGGAEAVSQS